MTVLVIPCDKVEVEQKREKNAGSNVKRDLVKINN
jgi:hypothetical protein